MSEALRLCGNFISQKGVLDSTIRIGCFKKSRIPKIIGLHHKHILENLAHKLKDSSYVPDRNLILLRALISVLAIFRACSPTHEIKFSTVTSPFGGKSKTYDHDIVRNVLDSMNIEHLEVKQPYFFKSNKTGANAMIA
jgi:hypothetical protein